MFKVGDKVRVKSVLPEDSVRDKKRYTGQEFVIEYYEDSRDTYKYELRGIPYGWEEAEFEPPCTDERKRALQPIVDKIIKDTERVIFEELIKAHEERIKLWKEYLERL